MKTFLHPSKIVATLLLLLTLFFSSAIFGQATKTWVPTTGGAWNTAGNWSPSGAPAAGDHVIINSDQSGDITAHPAISLGSLTVSGNCTLESNAGFGQTRLITVTGTFSIAAGKTLNLGIAGTGRTDFTLASTATGTINGTLNQYTNAFVARTITIQGNLTMSSAGLITGQNTNANFILASGATLQIGSSAGITTTGATGNVRASGTRTFNVAANYIYNGGGAQAAGTGLPATVGSLAISNNTILTLPGAKVVTNNFSISAGSSVNLGTFSHTAGTLTMGGFGTPSGSHGSTTSAATNKNNTFFAATTGIVTVGTGSCSAISGVLSGTNAICNGGSTDLAVTITGGLSTYTVVYSGGTVNNYTSGSAIPVSPITTTGYTLTSVKDSNGCTASVAGSPTVTVNAVPVSGTLTPTPAAGTVCAGSSVSATATAGSGGAGAIVDELEVSLSGGAYAAYTSGTSISTTGQTTVAIRTRRTATGSGCTSSSYNTVTWTMGAIKTYNSGWTPSAPTSSDAAIISSNYNVAANISACSLTVNSSAIVTIPTGNSVTLDGPLTVSSGSFTLENNAYLLQTTNAINSGNITVKRNTAAIMRLDYTLWSSPVSGQGLYAFSPLTFPTRFYQYLALTDVYNNSLGFNITGLDGNGVNGTDSNNVPFATAKGYLIRTPWNHPTAPAVWAGQFTGVPNNGDINYALETTGAGFNAIGNPYPSPVDITTFLANNSTKIASTLWFWRKTNNPNNLITPTTSYITYSGGTYSSGNEPYYNIQPGQGFIVQATAAGDVVFNNGQRVATDGRFFRNNPQATSAGEGRLWLKLKRDTELAGSIAIGYKDGATNDLDTDFDGKYINDSSLALTSSVQGQELAVQHRATPFVETDIVPLSFKTVTAGTYSIEFNGTDGVLDTQDVYLEDLLLNQTVDIKANPYTFTSAVGVYAERFRIVYVNNALGTDTPTFNANQVVIYKNEANDFVINSGNVIMASVKVFDIRGRLLLEREDINASQTTMTVGTTNEVLLVQITSEDGVVVTKKVVR